jgi:ribose 5-phosphate isomerase B
MIFIGADHRGWKQKEEIKKWLVENGEDVVDLGAQNYETEDDYPDFAIKVAEKVVLENGKGIVICGSGVGASIAANKVKGARAGLCLLEKQVRVARNDDNINILVLSADLIPIEDNLEITNIFLKTVFSSEEKYLRRINKIKSYENK